MSAVSNFLTWKKGNTLVSWVLFRLLIQVLFHRENVPRHIELLDDTLTNHCSRQKRNRWVNTINFLVGPRFVRRLIENRLNKGMAKHERVFLSLDKELKQEDVFSKDKTFRQKWGNWYGNHFSEPLQFFVPGNGAYEDFSPEAESCSTYDYEGLVEVVDLVKEAEKNGKKIRAVGSGHALTEVAQCEDYLVCTQHLNQTQRPARDCIKAAYVDGFTVAVNYCNEPGTEMHYLFETGGGTKIRHLIQALTHHGYALINQGGSSIQSISGAIATSTHGSGINIGPVSAFVRSMTLVGKGGKVYRVEPTDGITDPDWFEKDEMVQKHGITLIQDDEKFNAVMVGIGSVGIVFSMILEAQPEYRLQEERIMRNWEDVKVEMQQGDLYAYINSHRHFEVLINPYRDLDAATEAEQQRKCLVTTRNYSQQQHEKHHAGRERNYISTFISGIAISGKLSPWVFNKNHLSIPRMTNNSIKRLVDHKGDEGGGYEDLARNVLDQGLGELKFYGYAIEFGFPIDRVFEAVDRIIAVCEESQRYNQLLAAPFSLRFVKQCPAHLSMMQQGDMCMIELVSVKGVTGSLPLFMRLERELLAIGAVPHWGLSVEPWYREMVEKAFPRFSDWEKEQEFFGGDTFRNAFLDRIKQS
ncbi:D-arabinono-1,4-lactone oxidase [Cyclobacterium xiamenense]|uniref:D-arabinono-1,4-lactone oxidase n=1 Tax=Cyclobacterium xiamenense TaxID=1297121 RepID=UPI0012B81371|nr:FAD-binding protein [Cyclobacterium xiamenense]